MVFLFSTFQWKIGRKQKEKEWAILDLPKTSKIASVFQLSHRGTFCPQTEDIQGFGVPLSPPESQAKHQGLSLDPLTFYSK